QVIFLTGATGFVGKVLVEKILRSLPTVGKVYLLMRVSGKNTLQTRINEEIFGSHLFETLKSQYATEIEFYEKVMSRVVPVQGDISLENLGMSAGDIEMVQADTTVLISCAASVSFTMPLREALNMNCYGPLRIFRLAQGMSKLAALVQVSTSYVNAHMKSQHIEEKIYPYPLGDAEELFERFAKMSEDEIEAYERNVALKSFPNTYVVAKALTEQLIKGWSQSMNLPVVIVRPSMVGASISEPVPGWVEGMGAMIGPTALCGLGIMQEWIGNVNIVADVVPVDMVCNTILMAATQARQGLPNVPVFQSGTSTQNPVLLNQILYSIEQYWNQAKLTKIRRVSNDIRYVMYSAEDYELRFKQRFAKELEMAKEDGQGKLSQKLAKTYKMPKLNAFFGSYEFFLDSSNSVALDDLAPKELCSNLQDGFDWTSYMHNYCMGVHEYILKDDVNRTHVVKYTWTDQQRRFSPINDSSEASQLSSRL
ncbi:cyclin-dependent kinase inhibitor far1, partial [Mortierella sp. AD094]